MAKSATLPAPSGAAHYTDLQKWPDRLDSRVWIVGFVSATVWISLIDDLVSAICILGVLAVCQLTLRNRNHLMGDGRFGVWRIAVAGSVLTIVLHALFGSGHVAAAIDIVGLRISHDALRQGALMAVRLMSLIVLASIIISQVSATWLAGGLARLTLPLRGWGVAVGQVYYLAFFVSRSVPALLHESRMIALAQRSRGIGVGKWSNGRIFGPIALIIPVFSAALRRAEAVALLLASRGFRPNQVPYAVATMKLQGLDYFVLALLCAVWVAWAILMSQS